MFIFKRSCCNFSSLSTCPAFFSIKSESVKERKNKNPPHPWPFSFVLAECIATAPSSRNWNCNFMSLCVMLSSASSQYFNVSVSLKRREAKINTLSFCSRGRTSEGHRMLDLVMMRTRKARLRWFGRVQTPEEGQWISRGGLEEEQKGE